MPNRRPSRTPSDTETVTARRAGFPPPGEAYGHHTPQSCCIDRARTAGRLQTEFRPGRISAPGRSLRRLRMVGAGEPWPRDQLELRRCERRLVARRAHDLFRLDATRRTRRQRHLDVPPAMLELRLGSAG